MKIISNRMNLIYLLDLILLAGIFFIWIYIFIVWIVPLLSLHNLFLITIIFLWLIFWMMPPLRILFYKCGYLKFIDFQEDKIDFGGFFKKRDVDKAKVNKIYYIEKLFVGELHISTTDKHYKMKMMLKEDQIEQLRKEIKNVQS